MQVIGTLCVLFVLSIQLAPVLGLLMLTVSILVGTCSHTVSLIVILSLWKLGSYSEKHALFSGVDAKSEYFSSPAA